MTTPKEFYETLAQAEPCTMAVPQLPIRIGTQDIIAARLLLWLYDQMPDATQDHLDDVLDAAKWWSTFFASAHTATSQPNKAINRTETPSLFT